MLESGTDWAQVRLILAAHRRDARRRRESDAGARALHVARAVLVAAVVPAAGVGAGQALRGLGPELALDGLHLTYFLVFVVLAAGPLLGGGRAGSPARARLAHLPVTGRTAFTATAASITLSAGTLGVVLAAACLVIGYGGGAWFVLWRLLLLAPLTVCGVALGQWLLLAFARVLAARRFRVAGALLPIAVLLLALLGLRSASATSLETVVRDFGAWRDWTVVLPSWWAAAAATARVPVDVLPSLGLPLLGWWLVVAGGLAEAGAADAQHSCRVRRAPARPRQSVLDRCLPGPLAATLGKDLKLLAREPALRAVLAPQAALALLPAALVSWAALAAAGGDASAADELRRLYPLLPALGYTLVLLEATVLLNLLGLEGRGLAHWLSLPEPRRTLLLGKNLSVLLTLGPLNLVLVAGPIVAAGLVTGGQPLAVSGDAALAALEALCVLAAALSVGDVVSALRPSPLAGVGRGADAVRSAGRSDAGGLVVGGLAATACAAVVLPVGLLFHHPALLGSATHAWLPFTIPLAVAGAAGLAFLGARAGGSLLAGREAAARRRLSWG